VDLANFAREMAQQAKLTLNIGEYSLFKKNKKKMQKLQNSEGFFSPFPEFLLGVGDDIASFISFSLFFFFFLFF
jgi:hypothetical protein